MGTLRRKDLKPARKISDAAFLAGAQRSATRAANRAARRQAFDRAEAEAARQARALQPLARTAQDRTS